MTREEKLAFAQKIVDVLRVLNRPPRKIRTDSGFTTTHELLRRRARVELGVEFPDTPGNQWRVYDEKKHAVALKVIGVCIECGEPFVKRNVNSRVDSKRCRSKHRRILDLRRRAANPEKWREMKREKNPEKARARLAKWHADHPTYYRDRYAKDPKRRREINARSRARRANKKASKS